MSLWHLLMQLVLQWLSISLVTRRAKVHKLISMHCGYVWHDDIEASTQNVVRYTYIVQQFTDKPMCLGFMTNVSFCVTWAFGADSRFAPTQWETALLCNDVPYWLVASHGLYVRGCQQAKGRLFVGSSVIDYVSLCTGQIIMHSYFPDKDIQFYKN